MYFQAQYGLCLPYMYFSLLFYRILGAGYINRFVSKYVQVCILTRTSLIHHNLGLLILKFKRIKTLFLISNLAWIAEMFEHISLQFMHETDVAVLVRFVQEDFLASVGAHSALSNLKWGRAIVQLLVTSDTWCCCLGYVSWWPSCDEWNEIVSPTSFC